MGAVDYCIYEVSYNSEGTHIEKVKLYDYRDGTLKSPSIWSRTDVVSSLENGINFKTIVRVNNEWNWGEDVRIVVVNKTKFIRTDSNNTESDNLGNLPEF